MTKTSSKKKEEEKEGKERATFIVKPIQKKKNPQQTMEKYFAVTKQKGSIGNRSGKNFQGFPLSQCKLEPAIGKFVYRPPTYYEKKPATKSSREPALCQHCLLRPCMVKDRWEELMSACGDDVGIFDKDQVDLIYFRMLNHAECIFVETFGPKYARTTPLPACINKRNMFLETFGPCYAGKYCPSTEHGGTIPDWIKVLEEEDHEEDPDKELIDNSVDASQQGFGPGSSPH